MRWPEPDPCPSPCGAASASRRPSPSNRRQTRHSSHPSPRWQSRRCRRIHSCLPWHRERRPRHLVRLLGHHLLPSQPRHWCRRGAVGSWRGRARQQCRGCSARGPCPSLQGQRRPFPAEGEHRKQRRAAAAGGAAVAAVQAAGAEAAVVAAATANAVAAVAAGAVAASWTDRYARRHRPSRDRFLPCPARTSWPHCGTTALTLG
mmetsp:Transcript_36115/g.83810  ORF Transcript_36115/g.83810 Transcript_36115/m.83810 type:complete len:204 (+) Transcript_36115:716-1327(+)